MEYALLGLVGRAPMAGYDVHKVFAITPLAHFSSSPGAIYPALRRLARAGLLKARLDRTVEARPRRVYAPTRAGSEALEAWLRQPVTREELIRGGGAPILRFALAEGRLSKADVLAYLRSYRKAVQSYLEELYTHRERISRSGPLHGRLALELGIGGFESELGWVKSAAEKINRAGRPSRRRRA
jgi:DNA-binding PadR family transcriptional regulator